MMALGQWMKRWGALLTALVLASQVALAQKATVPRVAVLDFEGDRRGALRTQLEAGLKKNKQVELVALKQYMAAAGKAGLKGAAARAPEGVAQVAPGLELDAVVTATAERSLKIQVLGSDGRELWIKSVKLQRGKMSASDVRRLVAGIATTAANPPPALRPPAPPEEPAKPAPVEPPAPPPPEVTPAPAPQPAPAAKPPPVEKAPPALRPAPSVAPPAEPPAKSPSEPLEVPTSLDDESHTSTRAFDEYASRAELEAQDHHRHPPILHLFVGGATTWRHYCARPGATSCAEFDSRPEESRVGDTIDFNAGVPYLAVAGQLEVLPLALSERPWRGLGVVVGYQRGYSETRVKVTTQTGETPTRSVVATDSVLTGMLLYRYYFNLGTQSRPRLAYAGFKGGMLGRAFEVDPQARAPLTGSHRVHPAVGLEFSVPLRHWLAVEGGGQYFIGPKAGKSLTADQGALELEVRDLGAQVSSSGWYAELGLAGELWGPLGYSVRGRYTTVKDTFTGAGARFGWSQGGVASEQNVDIRWGLTASY
jgi:outer membrane biosynthesis protein TonB